MDAAEQRDKDLVRDSYDQIYARYEAWDDEAIDNVRQQALERALSLIPTRSHALDLGCGPGRKTSRLLATSFEHLTAVDISPRSIAAARAHLPHAELLVADMTTVELPSATFDLVTAFFSIIHVPAGEQPALFTRIAGWLVPDGVLVCNLGASAGDQREDFLGAPMFWSALTPAESVAAVERAGLDVLHHEIDERTEHGVAVRFLWITARRPAAT
ncbi:MAG: class I SAM-dependent DNA methyltransferase [Acidimicrobiia bacterium]